MQIISFGLGALAMGVLQIFATYSWLNASAGDTLAFKLTGALLVVGLILAIVSLKREKQIKVVHVMAWIGLLLSLSPIIIIFTLIFFRGGGVPSGLL
jgi:hypothetical protein